MDSQSQNTSLQRLQNVEKVYNNYKTQPLICKTVGFLLEGLKFFFFCGSLFFMDWYCNSGSLGFWSWQEGLWMSWPAQLDPERSSSTATASSSCKWSRSSTSLAQFSCVLWVYESWMVSGIYCFVTEKPWFWFCFLVTWSSPKNLNICGIWIWISIMGIKLDQKLDNCLLTKFKMSCHCQRS